MCTSARNWPPPYPWGDWPLLKGQFPRFDSQEKLLHYPPSLSPPLAMVAEYYPTSLTYAHHHQYWRGPYPVPLTACCLVRPCLYQRGTLLNQKADTWGTTTVTQEQCVRMLPHDRGGTICVSAWQRATLVVWRPDRMLRCHIATRGSVPAHHPNNLSFYYPINLSTYHYTNTSSIPKHSNINISNNKTNKIKSYQEEHIAISREPVKDLGVFLLGGILDRTPRYCNTLIINKENKIKNKIIFIISTIIIYTLINYIYTQHMIDLACSCD